MVVVGYLDNPIVLQVVKGNRLLGSVELTSEAGHLCGCFGSVHIAKISKSLFCLNRITNFVNQHSLKMEVQIQLTYNVSGSSKRNQYV